VSDGPGKDDGEWPVSEEGTDRSFFMFVEPHFGHLGSSDEKTRTSLTSLQSWHSYS